MNTPARSTSTPNPVGAKAVSTDAPWTIQDAIDLYGIEYWSNGFFHVNSQGNVTVRPKGTPDIEVDLLEVIEGLRDRDIIAPLLIHFTDILDTRLKNMADAFHSAIADNEYTGQYIGVYPIKVNHQRKLVERIELTGRQYSFGLEAGSKPELLAILGLTAQTPDRLIVCNGFKEERYIKHIMLANKLGRRATAVIENLDELELIINAANEFKVRPHIGVRINIATRGAGRWAKSTGHKAKFGLTIAELVYAVKRLKKVGLLDCLELLHCHMGSQMSDIKMINNGVNELARVYAELIHMGTQLKHIDVGGGLGIDYDGSQQASDYSTNYTLEEYAATVVYRIKSVCDEADVPHPNIITESGRATVSYQSILAFEVLGTNTIQDTTTNYTPQTDENKKPVRVIQEMMEIAENIDDDRLQENFHDLQTAREQALMLFSLGHLNLEDAAHIEQLFWSQCAIIIERAQKCPDGIPPEIAEFEQHLSDTYFCNLSIFQSLPDSWAIGQMFPILPLHRLNEHPNRKATIADVTCDSDGCIDQFIGEVDTEKWLNLHPYVENQRYYLGAFLVGAYQEALGDLHNLFGDVNSVYITLDEDGRWSIDDLDEGDTVSQVLSYYKYDVKILTQAIRNDCERCIREGNMTPTESRELLKAYELGLAGYTYLE